MLIGITGVINSGKSYTADLIKSYYKYKTFDYLKINNNSVIEVHSLSYPIKHITKYLFPRWGKYEYIYGKLKEVVDDEYGVSPRFVQQIIGVELMKIKPNLWSQILFDKLEHRKVDLLNSKNLIVIDDVRSIHDFKAIKDRGGIMIHLISYKDSGCSDETMNNKSELQMKEIYNKCDYEFVNTYNKEYDKKIEKFIKGVYCED